MPNTNLNKITNGENNTSAGLLVALVLCFIMNKHPLFYSLCIYYVIPTLLAVLDMSIVFLRLKYVRCFWSGL